MPQPKHTHPLGVIQQIAVQLKDNWYLIALLLWQNPPTIVRIIAIPILVIWLFGWPFLRWLTLTYQLTDDAVIVHSGVIVRHHRHIPYARLQTVQRKQWFYLRPFHLETLQLETASHQDDGPEVRLPAVPTSVADAIEHHRPTAPTVTASPVTTTPAAEPVPTADDVTSYRIDRRALSLFALTGTGIIPLFLVLLWGYGKLPHDWSNVLLADLHHTALPWIIGAGIVILLLAWVGTYIWVLIRYYHFTLSRTANQLKIAKGLFQRDTISASLDRIQAVRAKQSILRQWCHLQTVQVLLASKAATDDDDNDLVILPAIAQPQLYAILHPFIDWIPVTAPDLTPLRVPRTAAWLLSRNAVLWVLLPVVGLSWFWRPWGWLSLFLLPLAWLQGQYVARNTGGRLLLSADLLVLQTGHFWTRETFFVPRQRIQSLEQNWSVWMAARNLTHLTINLRHGNGHQAVELRYLSAAQVDRIYRWYHHASTN